MQRAWCVAAVLPFILPAACAARCTDSFVGACGGTQMGITPLYAAASNGFAECVRALLDGSADKEVTTEVRIADSVGLAPARVRCGWHARLRR
jgi:hypothetical protein